MSLSRLVYNFVYGSYSIVIFTSITSLNWYTLIGNFGQNSASKFGRAVSKAQKLISYKIIGFLCKILLYIYSIEEQYEQHYVMGYQINICKLIPKIVICKMLQNYSPVTSSVGDMFSITEKTVQNQHYLRNSMIYLICIFKIIYIIYFQCDLQIVI